MGIGRELASGDSGRWDLRGKASDRIRQGRVAGSLSRRARVLLSVLLLPLTARPLPVPASRPHPSRSPSTVLTYPSTTAPLRPSTATPVSFNTARGCPGSVALKRSDACASDASTHLDSRDSRPSSSSSRPTQGPCSTRPL